MIFDIIIGN